MAIPTNNTRQTDSGSNPAAYNPFPAYKPWNPFAGQPKKTVRERYPAYWRGNPNAAGGQQPQQSSNPFGEQTRRVVNMPLPLPVVRIQQQRENQLVLQQELRNRANISQMMSPTGQTSLFRNIPGVNANGFPRGISQGGYVPYGPIDYTRARQSQYNEWQASGGVNRQLTDWFDPYDPAGSPYMTSQYIPQTDYTDYGGGYGYGGGWGGGGSYEQQDTAPFYQGNYTQRRNRWNETLLTWGLRQQ